MVRSQMAHAINSLWQRINGSILDRETTLVQYRESLIHALNSDLELDLKGGLQDLPATPLQLRSEAIHPGQENGISIEEVLKRRSHVVILGPAGSGKSTLLKYVAVLSAGGLILGVPNIP